MTGWKERRKEAVSEYAKMSIFGEAAIVGLLFLSAVETTKCAGRYCSPGRLMNDVHVLQSPKAAPCRAKPMSSKKPHARRFTVVFLLSAASPGHSDVKCGSSIACSRGD